MAGPLETISPRLTRLSKPRDGSGREVLFLHGAWHGAWCWNGLTEPVAKAGHGVNLLDLPGHGAEDRKLSPFTSLNRYAAYARQAVESLDRPVLVAHSMGGWIAQKLLEEMDLPTVLLAPLPGNGLPGKRLARFCRHHFWGFLKLIVLRPLRIKDAAMVKMLFLGEVSEKTAVAHLSRLVPEPFWVALGMGIGLTRAEARPGKEPRLVIATDEDFFFPLSVEDELAVCLEADFVELKGLPHNMWQVDPSHQVRDLLLDFLARLSEKP